ncbi:MAG: SsrA-binding protein SmpB [Candidatus Anammoxibacter sp.]
MSIIAKNKKAGFLYEFIERFEVGIILKGTEVKSLRNKKVNINDGYAKFRNNEMYVVGINISHYEQGNLQNHEPTRDRKLLLHKREIKRLIGKVQTKGLTVIPTLLYFNKRGIAKLELALGRGKSKVDKREKIKKRTVERDIRRVMLEKR